MNIYKEANDKNVSSIDLKPYLHYHYTDFITELYKLTLHRLPDESGMNNMLNIIRHNGASVGVLVYIVAISDEFKNTGFNIKDIEYYKKLYKKYIRKNYIKELPIIGRIVKLYSLTHQINALSDDISFLIGKLTKKVNNQLEDINNKFDNLKERIGVHDQGVNDQFEDINNKFDNLKERIGIYDQGVNEQFEGINNKFEGINNKFDNLKERIGLRDQEVNEQFKGINNKFDNLKERISIFDQGVNEQFEGINRNITENEQNISSKLYEIETFMNVYQISNAGLSPANCLENIQVECLYLLNDKNYEIEAYNRLPIEILAGYAEGKTIAVAHYSKLISEYAATNNMLKIDAARIELSRLPDICQGKDTLIISNPALSALVVTNPNLIMEISRRLKRNLVLSVWSSTCPIHAIWEGFGGVEKEEGKGYFKWAEGRNCNWQIRLFSSLYNSVKAELGWSSESFLGMGELTASCCGKTIKAELNSNVKLKLNIILHPGVNILNFFWRGGVAWPEGTNAYRLLAFRVIDFTCQTEGVTINQELLYTNSRHELLGDNYIRRQLHKNGFYDIRAKAYSNHGFNEIMLPDSRFNYSMISESGEYFIKETESPEYRSHDVITLYSACRLRRAMEL